MAELNEEREAAMEDMQGVCAGEAMLDSHRTDVAPGGLLPSLTAKSGYDTWLAVKARQWKGVKACRASSRSGT